MAKRTEIGVKGMTCSGCARTVSSYLEKQGAHNVVVQLGMEQVSFDNDPALDLDKLEKGIEKLGYSVAHDDSPQRDWFSIKLWVSALLTIPLLLHMFTDAYPLAEPWFQFALALPVYLTGVDYFGRSGWASIRNGSPNMDVLIFIGSTAAFAYSTVGWIQNLGHDFMFFETSSSIITLVLFGNFLERRSLKQSSSAIRELIKLQPEYADLILPNNQIRNVRVEELRPGDLVQVNMGGSIPIDGMVVEGNGTVDKSIITGESLPESIAGDEEVVGGTTLVEGSIQLKVINPSDETVLSRIINSVQEAELKKPAIQNLADRISGIFVPTVLLISIGTLLVWFMFTNAPVFKGLMAAVAVLVISCPCAMGLATPAVVAVGVGRAARKGILFKSAEVLEEISKVKTVVFDKTGTLTTGELTAEVVDSKITTNELNLMVSSLERYSSHPISEALIKTFYSENRVEMTDVVEIPGVGLRAKYNGDDWSIGSFKLHVDLKNDHDVFLLKNNEILARIDIYDKIRNEALDVVKSLKERGIEVILLSGDRESKCAHIANELRIDSWFSEQSPSDKLAIIEELNSKGLTAMVGDGVNDAPSLSTARIGISLADASTIAVQSSEVILLNNDLRDVMNSLKIGKLSLQTIRQNLFWAFAYNIVAIPIAAAGLLVPMVAAFSMAFSDLVIIGNSLRMRFKM